MKFEDYIEKLKKHSVGVIGIGVSNTPLINTFLKYGIKVTAYDKRSFYELDDRAKKFAGEQNVELVLGNDYLDNLHNEILFRLCHLRSIFRKRQPKDAPLPRKWKRFLKFALAIRSP